MSDKRERELMEIAIQQARKSVPEGGHARPKVGAVVVKDDEILATAFRGEIGKGQHAEYTALEKKLEDVTLAGATVYTTLEPCTTRNHPKVPCAVRLLERRVARVVIGMLDPNPTIRGLGERFLRDHGIVVDRFPNDLILQLEELNREFTRAQTQAADAQRARLAEGQEEILKAHRRRLLILRVQAATFGLHTPPHIMMEIDDIEAKITSLSG
jgi:pyrimidine deaminase RibD-like protein